MGSIHTSLQSMARTKPLAPVPPAKSTVWVLEPLRKGLMIKSKLPAPPAEEVVWQRVDFQQSDPQTSWQHGKHQLVGTQHIQALELNW
jgi:hypothetical protein